MQMDPNVKQVRIAIKSGDFDTVVELLDSAPDLVSAVTPFGTWLHVAASKGELKIARWLVDKGMDINQRGGISDATPLHTAASNGHVDIVVFLLEEGAVMDTSEPERNPLFGAIYGGHQDIAKILIERGIDTRVKYNGESMKNMGALAFAVEWDQFEVAEILRKDAEKTSS